MWFNAARYGCVSAGYKKFIFEITAISRIFTIESKTNCTMKQGWIKIFSSLDVLQAKLAEDLLKQNGIESHILAKPDSMIPSVGEAELYTLPEKAEQAVSLLKENGLL